MKRSDLRHLFLLVPIGILLAIQLPNLSLPYFWDEAWSYVKAIKRMADAGPSLLPGKVPMEYCKGHPQFFYFLTSVWMRLFNGSIAMMRILSLLISLSLILVVYSGLLKMANWQSAITGATLISVQSMFLAQSILILPEVIVSLFFILSFFFFLSRNYVAYAIASILMVQTKETTIVFALVFGLFYLFSMFDQTERKKFNWMHLLALIAPGLIYLIFLALHKLSFGIAFNSDHLNYFSTNFDSIVTKTKSALAYIFIHSGRSVLTVLATVSLLVAIIRNPSSRRPIILALVSIFCYIGFSVLNFFSPRYELVAIVTFITIFAWQWGQLKMNQYMKYIIIIALSIVCLNKSLTKKNSLDITLGYVETVKVHQEIINYCEKNRLQDESFAVSFNMIYYMSDRTMGYIQGKKEFTNIYDWTHYREAKYFIFESTFENNEVVHQVKNEFIQIYSCTDKHAWGYIYENPNYTEPKILN